MQLLTCRFLRYFRIRRGRRKCGRAFCNTLVDTCDLVHVFNEVPYRALTTRDLEVVSTRRDMVERIVEKRQKSNLPFNQLRRREFRLRVVLNPKQTRDLLQVNTVYCLFTHRDNGYGPETERLELGLAALVCEDVGGLELNRTGREEFFNP